MGMNRLINHLEFRDVHVLVLTASGHLKCSSGPRSTQVESETPTLTFKHVYL